MPAIDPPQVSFLIRLRELQAVWILARKRCEATACKRKATKQHFYELTDDELGHGTIGVWYCDEHSETVGNQ